MKMLTVWTTAALAGLVLAAGGCGPSSNFAGNLETVQRDLAQNGLAVRWTAKLPLDSGRGEQVQHLYRREGHLYAMTSANRLLTLSAQSGQLLWSAELGSDRMATTPVAQVADRVTLVTVLDMLYGFNVETGERTLVHDLKRSPSTRPVAVGGYVYFGTNEGWLDALNLLSPLQNWDRRTSGAILAAPVSDGQQVYFANIDGEVLCSSAQRRSERWRFPAKGNIGAVVADLKRSPTGLILVPSRDYSLYALNPTNGLPAWVCTTGDPLLKPAHCAGDRIYIVSEQQVLFALRESNGEKPLWTTRQVTDFVAASPALVYVQNSNGKIAALSPADGALKFAFTLPGIQFVASNDIDGQIFAASRSGDVVAIREKDGQDYEDERPVVTEKPVEVEPVVTPKATEEPTETMPTPARTTPKATTPKPLPTPKPMPTPRPGPMPKGGKAPTP